MQDERVKELMREFVLSESQVHETYKRFSAEIAKGLAAETHTRADTKCFATYVHNLPTGDERGKYLALDLGGTNFRVLLVTLEGHHDAVVESEIYAVSKQLMLGPGTQLFDHIAQCLATFVHEKSLDKTVTLPLGFTFSFPCTQLGLTQAKLVRWTKGFQCSGVVDVDVCRLLKEAIARRDDVEIDVMAILNDTTGTLMSCAHRNPDCRIGVIVGTGCNACYVERTECVETLPAVAQSSATHVLVNTEWGALGDGGVLEFIRTDYDRRLDAESLNRGSQLFEKMISGMYLGELVRLPLLKAIERELIFTANAGRAALYNRLISVVGVFETCYISEIESDKFPEFTNTKRILRELGAARVSVEDCQKLRFMCECVSQRAAKLVAIGLSGLINRIDERRVVVGVDGSVYRYHPKFDAYMRETMQKLVKPSIAFEMMLSEDGSGRGAALVAAVANDQKYKKSA